MFPQENKPGTQEKNGGIEEREKRSGCKVDGEARLKSEDYYLTIRYARRQWRSRRLAGYGIT